MKKHLIAFLSMIGLAGSAAPATAQVLKGTQEKSKLKTESQIKTSKQNAEKTAVKNQIQDKRKDKWAKADTEHKSAKTDLQHKSAKTETWIKGGKNQSEQKNLKLKQETVRNQTGNNGQKNTLTKAKGQEQK